MMMILFYWVDIRLSSVLIRLMKSFFYDTILGRGTLMAGSNFFAFALYSISG